MFLTQRGQGKSLMVMSSKISLVEAMKAVATLKQQLKDASVSDDILDSVQRS